MKKLILMLLIVFGTSLFAQDVGVNRKNGTIRLNHETDSVVIGCGIAPNLPAKFSVFKTPNTDGAAVLGANVVTIDNPNGDAWMRGVDGYSRFLSAAGEFSGDIYGLAGEVWYKGSGTSHITGRANAADVMIVNEGSTTIDTAIGYKATYISWTGATGNTGTFYGFWPAYWFWGSGTVRDWYSYYSPNKPTSGVTGNYYHVYAGTGGLSYFGHSIVAGKNMVYAGAKFDGIGNYVFGDAETADTVLTPGFNLRNTPLRLFAPKDTAKYSLVYIDMGVGHTADSSLWAFDVKKNDFSNLGSTDFSINYYRGFPDPTYHDLLGTMKIFWIGGTTKNVHFNYEKSGQCSGTAWGNVYIDNGNFATVSGTIRSGDTLRSGNWTTYSYVVPGGDLVKSSSSQLKTNIKVFTPRLYNFKKVVPKTYNFKTKSGFDAKKKFVGLMADEFNPKILNKKSGELDNAEVIATMWLKIVELESRIDKQQKQIDSLRNR